MSFTEMLASKLLQCSRTRAACRALCSGLPASTTRKKPTQVHRLLSSLPVVCMLLCIEVIYHAGTGEIVVLRHGLGWAQLRASMIL